MGAGFEAETPIRIRFSAGVGWLPTAYAWAARQIYDIQHDGREAVGRVIQELTENSFVTGGHITYRPWERHGFYFGAGYTLQWAEKSGLFAGQFEVATGEMLPAAEGMFARQYTVNEKLHFLNAVIGWQWGIHEGLTLRAQVGVAWVVHASTELQREFTAADPAATMAFERAVEKRIEDDSDYLAPTASVYLGYNFR